MTNKFWLSRQTFKSMKLNWNFLGGRRVQNKKAFCGGSLDIFWKCTIEYNMILKLIISYSENKLIILRFYNACM